MKKNEIGYYVLGTLLLISIIMSKNTYLDISIWIVATIGLIIKVGFPKYSNYCKNSIIRVVIICLFSYFIVTYGLGIITGFVKNVFSLEFKKIIGNIYAPFIMIVLQEMIRYIYAKNSQYNNKKYIFLTIIYIFLDIIMEFKISYLQDFEVLFIFTCVRLLPTIATQAVYSYLSYKVDYVPALITRIVFELYIYFVPIYPALGDYINSVLGVLYPVIVYFVTSRIIKDSDKRNKYVAVARKNYVIYPLIIITSVLVVLVSGIGKYKMVAIGSGSMEPEFYRGDAVIYKKIDASDVIIGNILAFEVNNTLVTHRVVGISKGKDGYKFVTKGDNNGDVDKYIVSENEVRGIVNYKISYIGMPTIWIQDFFDNI